MHLLALDAESWRSKSNLTLFPSGATSQETHLVLLLEAEGPGKEDGGADEVERPAVASTCTTPVEEAGREAPPGRFRAPGPRSAGQRLRRRERGTEVTPASRGLLASERRRKGEGGPMSPRRRNTASRQIRPREV